MLNTIIITTNVHDTFCNCLCVHIQCTCTHTPALIECNVYYVHVHVYTYYTVIITTLYNTHVYMCTCAEEQCVQWDNSHNVVEVECTMYVAPECSTQVGG